MMKAIVRTSLTLGVVGAVVYAARRAMMSSTEKAVDTVKDTAEKATSAVKSNVQEITKDAARKDEHLTASLGAIAHRVG